MSDKHHCPTCHRQFVRVFDYPRVFVERFEQLPLPEAIDDMSGAAAERQLARRRAGVPPEAAFRSGINMTPEIERACSTTEIQAYFERLARLTGQTVDPNELRPPFPSDTRFKWTHPIPGTSLALAIHDPEPPNESGGQAMVDILCPGPNLGSAGGPTMQILGAIARIDYRGVIEPTGGTP
jgi:hypothetical protein